MLTSRLKQLIKPAWSFAISSQDSRWFFGISLGTPLRLHIALNEGGPICNMVISYNYAVTTKRKWFFYIYALGWRWYTHNKDGYVPIGYVYNELGQLWDRLTGNLKEPNHYVRYRSR